MIYDLPKSIEIDETEREIRTDFRVILEVIEALHDPDMKPEERVYTALSIFFIDDLAEFENLEAAVQALFWFIDGGRNERSAQQNKQPLIDWGHDWEHIIAPVNRVLGYEARAVTYDPETNTGGVHWWTFIAAYMEIGNDCLISQIVQIRDKLRKGKKLETGEREWLNRNRDLVNLPTQYTDTEKEIEKAWT